MSEPYVGQIAIFGFNFAPQNWVFCNGALMSIQQNQVLFAVIGTTYGGNGIQNFAVPNIQNSGVVSWGQGPGLSSYVIGQTAGVADVTLTTGQMPQHNHLANAFAGSSQTLQLANASSIPNTGKEVAMFRSSSDGNTFNGATISIQGGSLPHVNQQPYLGMNFCIAQYGIFPSQS